MDKLYLDDTKNYSASELKAHLKKVDKYSCVLREALKLACSAEGHLWKEDLPLHTIGVPWRICSRCLHNQKGRVVHETIQEPIYETKIEWKDA